MNSQFQPASFQGGYQNELSHDPTEHIQHISAEIFQIGIDIDHHRSFSEELQ